MPPNYVHSPLTLLQIHHPLSFEEAMPRTEDCKYPTDIIIFELGNILHQGCLETVTRHSLQVLIRTAKTLQKMSSPHHYHRLT